MGAKNMAVPLIRLRKGSLNRTLFSKQKPTPPFGVHAASPPYRFLDTLLHHRSNSDASHSLASVIKMKHLALIIQGGGTQHMIPTSHQIPKSIQQSTQEPVLQQMNLIQSMEILKKYSWLTTQEMTLQTSIPRQQNLPTHINTTRHCGAIDVPEITQEIERRVKLPNLNHI